MSSSDTFSLEVKHITQIYPDDFGEHLAVLEAITIMFEKPFLNDRIKDSLV